MGILSKFQSRFGILQMVRAVADPFGIGITFHIRSKRHPAYKAFAAELAEKNQLSKAFQVELSRQQIKASMTGKKIDKEAAIDKAIDRAGLDVGSASTFIADNIRRVAHLLDGWEGEDVDFSLDNAIELLSLENPLEPDQPYATKTIEPDEEGGEAKTVHRTLGEALMAFIEEESDKEDLYIEGLAKNSAASSAGAPASSAG